ncbi:phosphatases II [Coniophora puteana RWD-64-598 SS2]|uniref:Phosphatases II n=1 Tax=Coniophora puteana (strain RWD-64-598) TaxID=741705 RepID=A0A5M3N7T0_CONPW|nr:phosphatases II [Coniophora puteana RWD-64-598 SS2]EIW87217.1 phosphatases II [Coniophora puteana RWD-64-598 SS2]
MASSPSPHESLPTWLGPIAAHLKTSNIHQDVVDSVEDIFGILQERERVRTQLHIQSRIQRLAPSGTGPEVDPVGHYSTASASQPQNIRKNRYRNILPYDRTRVIAGSTQSGGGRGDGRYINGNWVKERYGGGVWIATQAPIEGTFHSFFSILYHTISQSTLPPGLSSYVPANGRVHTVVQLTTFSQGQAESYFPQRPGTSLEVWPEHGCPDPPFRITTKKAEEESLRESRWQESTVTIQPQSTSSASQPVDFTHLLYEKWPDHGVPDSKDEDSLLAFLRHAYAVNHSLSQKANPGAADAPIIVHCSAGVGRTGTFIAISSLLRAYGLLDSRSAAQPQAAVPQSNPNPQIPKIPIDDLVAQEVDSLREQRLAMVQRETQLQMIYQCLIKAFRQRVS